MNLAHPLLHRLIATVLISIFARILCRLGRIFLVLLQQTLAEPVANKLSIRLKINTHVRAATKVVILFLSLLSMLQFFPCGIDKGYKSNPKRQAVLVARTNSELTSRLKLNKVHLGECVSCIVVHYTH